MPTMRKDLRLGLAIGAVFLAVVIVWAVVPHKSKNTAVGVKMPPAAKPADQAAPPNDNTTNNGTGDLQAPPERPSAPPVPPRENPAKPDLTGSGGTSLASGREKPE